ncbi:MAG TPA: peptidylprolyl isomerase [Planctomycetota bacterium]|nr:peptidylprolyl isomerase [Planctomycetota bacterium]
MRWMVAAILVASVGCDSKEGPAPLVPPISAKPAPPPAVHQAPPPPPSTPPGTKKMQPPKPLGANAEPVPEGEPARITVQHVLIAFKGAHRAPPTVTRTQEEARALADEILGRARNGEDIAELSKEYSSDPGGGRYTLVNTGVAKVKPTDILRGDFIKPFVNVAFKLGVGDVGLVDYDPKKDPDGRPRSPFGWHVIKRLE